MAIDDALMKHPADLADPVVDVHFGTTQAQRRFTAHRDAMFALSTVETEVCDIAHLIGIPTPEHLVDQVIIVGRLVARIHAFKPVPVLDKDQLEDVPVLRGLQSSGRTELGCWHCCGAAFLPHLTGSLHPLIGLRRGTLTHFSHPGATGTSGQLKNANSYAIKTSEIRRLVDTCYTRYRAGFVTNVQKGDVPTRYQSLARYLAKYVVSPPISLRRIDRYDGQRVTYHYRSHKSERVEWETVAVYTFIGRMVQHVFAKGFQRIRYYGVQATKTFAKLKGVMQAALAKVQGVVKEAIKIITPLTSRQRYQQSMGRDPLRCPHCHAEMEVWKIWHPKYGVIYDELEAMKRGKYASQAPRAAPTGSPGRTVRPAAGGIPLSLPGVP